MSKKDKKKRTDSMEDKKKNETRQSTIQNRMENMNGQKTKDDLDRDFCLQRGKGAA